MRRSERYYATQAGHEFYTSSRPCKRGHTAPRRVSNGSCTECLRRDTFLKKKSQYDRQYYLDRAEEKKRAAAQWREKNYEKHRQRVQEWQAQNKEKVLQYKRYHCAKRRSRIDTQTPSWASETAIKEIYDQCPKGMHVDHIIPIKGKRVSGLHVPENLQYLTPSENSRKSNRF